MKSRQKNSPQRHRDTEGHGEEGSWKRVLERAASISTTSSTTRSAEDLTTEAPRHEGARRGGIVEEASGAGGFVEDDELTGAIIGAAIAVHRALGPGLLESAYEQCLALELDSLSIPHRRQIYLPIVYRGVTVDPAYRLDLLVDDRVIVEVKATSKLLPVHEAQALTYLKLTGKRLALLLNFHAPVLRDGIKRLAL